MPVKNGDAVYLDAWCSSCEAPYYRSVRPLIVGRDKITPDLFAPITAGTPPPNPEAPECPTCHSPLRFVKAATVASTGEPPKRQARGISDVAPPLESAQVPETVVTLPQHTTQVLFEAGPDEKVLDIRDVGEAFVVVTSRRILKVSY